MAKAWLCLTLDVYLCGGQRDHMTALAVAAVVRLNARGRLLFAVQREQTRGEEGHEREHRALVGNCVEQVGLVHCEKNRFMHV